MKTILLVVLAPAVLLLIAGCQTAERRSDAPVPLTGTQWVLRELNGKPVVPGEGFQSPTLKLDAANKRVSGMSGINRYAGPCELDGATLRFGLFMGTRMAGPPEAMAAEDAFLAALGEVRAWKISGQILELSDGTKTVARFQATVPPDDAPAL